MTYTLRCVLCMLMLLYTRCFVTPAERVEKCCRAYIVEPSVLIQQMNLPSVFLSR